MSRYPDAPTEAHTRNFGHLYRPSPPPRRRVFPRTWKDAAYAATGLFFVSLSALCWALIGQLEGWHL